MNINIIYCNIANIMSTSFNPINIDTYFNDDILLQLIAALRAEAAFKNHDKYFLQDYESIDDPTKLLKQPITIYNISPPRSLWIKLSKKKRTSLSTLDYYKECILLTIKKYLYNPQYQEYKWIINLKTCIQNIKNKFINSQINPPAVINFIPKTDTIYRPIVIYSLEDQLLLSLTASYLTDTFDSIFSQHAIAFRSHIFQKATGIYNYHQLIQKLIYFNKHIKNNYNYNIYVTECDIKAFYDTINHDVILNILRKYKSIINKHVYNIIINYLKSYNFKLIIDKANKKKILIKYPEQDILREYNTIPNNIGIAQGGAISCWISNLILSEIDLLLTNKLHDDFDIYYRYCDDMILLTTNKKRGKLLYNLYCKTLKELKLFYHTPIDVKYSKEWYDVKTKVNYKWGPEFPYVSYLGYQIHYTNVIRIRKKSIDKEKDQQKEIINRVIEMLDNNKLNLSNHNKKKLFLKIKARWYKRIMGNSFVNVDKKNFAWSDGFKLLTQNEFDFTQIKNLDRHFNNQLINLKSKLHIKHIELKKELRYKGSYYSGITTR